jgi:hypothetical protein
MRRRLLLYFCWAAQVKKIDNIGVSRASFSRVYFSNIHAATISARFFSGEQAKEKSY